MRKVFLLISSLVIISFTLWFAFGYVEDEIGEVLKLYMGEVKILSVSKPTRVAIGNPNIADVTEVTKDEVTISPKATGNTTLVIWDNFGEHSYRIKVLAEDFAEIKRRIDNLLGKLNLPQVYTQVAEDEGKILLLGRVKNSQDRERVLTAIGLLKEKIVDLIEIKEEEAVVEIDVQVLELNKDAQTTLGFTWPGSIGLTDKSGPTTTAVTGLREIFHVSDFTRTAFNITLDALINEGKAKVLSRPRLACQSGKEAELLVGGEQPILTTETVTGGGVGTEVDYKEYGIKLKIKPTVTEKRQIKLVLNVEVSDVGASEITIGSATQPTAKAWPISKRTASTELVLNDQQTLAIGGLIKQKKDEDITKTPWLGDIPMLGLLFRKKTTKIGGGALARGDTELFITLTPTIVTGTEETAFLERKETRGSEVPLLGIKKETPSALQGYAQIIQKRILENLIYPASAKEAGFQGTIKLSLHLSYQGELLDVIIKDSTGYKVIDDNAVSVVKGISPYPPFPPSIDSKELWIDVPITYQLD